MALGRVRSKLESQDAAYIRELERIIKQLQRDIEALKKNKRDK